MSRSTITLCGRNEKNEDREFSWAWKIFVPVVIVDFILHNLHSGATLNEIIGAYDNTPRKEVITIVDKHEYRKLMDFVRKTDPKAFVTVYSVNEMRYQPKIKK